jgi:hypothetical protein
MKKVFFAIIFTCLLNQISAQISFTASAKKVVETNERFRLDFTINAVGDNFNPPGFSDFSVLGGPFSSTSSSFIFDNGKASQSVSTTYSYTLLPKKEGKFTIGKATITSDGKEYSSSPITIEVIKGESNPNNNNISENNPSDNNNDIFIQYNVDKGTVYKGEQVNVSLKIYDGVKGKSRGEGGLNGLSSFKGPDLKGFYSNIIMDPSQNALPNIENIRGKVYYTFKIWQAVLYAQQTGTITIDPFELGCYIVQKVKRRDIWGNVVLVNTDVPQDLRSMPVAIKVLPLPSDAPASFTGAVGSDFKFEVVVDKTELKSNESIALKIVLSGVANMKVVDKVKINFPSSFEVYDPKIKTDNSNAAQGSKGTNIYDYLIIPREPGEYTIPPIEFCYFDVKSKTYKLLKSQEFKFKIAKGDNVQNITAGVTKESVTQLGSDILFINQDEFELKKTNYSFFGSVSFYLIYFILIIVFLATIFILRHYIKQNKNISLLKNKRANKVSQKRLKTASICLKNGEKLAFYDEVIKALWGYLSDKLSIPVSELSRETARVSMQKLNIEETYIQEFIEVIDSCEFAKYAPSSGHNQIEQDFEKARKIINKLEQELS